MKTICLTTLSIILILSFGVMSAQADTAVAISGYYTYFNDPWCIGWQFDVNTPITVTALGFFDFGEYSGEPYYNLIYSHDVGIYDSSGTKLVEGTVNTMDPVSNFFRYTTSITPIANVLPIGTGYVIAASNPVNDPTYPDSDLYIWNPESCTFGPAISFVVGMYDNSTSSLVFPTSPDGCTGLLWTKFPIRSSCTRTRNLGHARYIHA